MDQVQVLPIAKQYAFAVREIMDTKSIILYGSYARGTATKDSDIHIAVIVDAIPGDYLNTVSMLWKLTRTVNFEIEPVLLTEADGDSVFLATVRRTGIAI